MIEPGLGYWMKSDKHGYLKLISSYSKDIVADDNSKSDVLARSTKLIIRDNSMHEGNLYMIPDKEVNVSNFELPPLPPAGLFDVRYNNNMYVNNNNASVISLQGITYPMSINIDYADANYTFYDAATNEELGSIQKGTTGNVEVFGTKGNSIKVMRTDNLNGIYSLVSQPNPVVNGSIVVYTVPENGNVTIKLYDALGNEVATIADGYASAGEHTASFNASNLASGRYICKMISGSHTEVLSISVVK